MDYLFTEVIKLKDGAFYNLPYHESRMKMTVKTFYNKSIDLSKILVPNDKITGLYKCRIVYSNKIHSLEFVSYVFRQIQNMRIVHSDNVEYAFKYYNRKPLDNLVADCGCDEVLIVKNGFVTDSSYSNLVFENSVGLFTPQTYLLNGTKRQLLLDEGSIQEQIIREADLVHYDSVYLINAMIDLDDQVKIPTASIKE